jgi:hypothetical protein
MKKLFNYILNIIISSLNKLSHHINRKDGLQLFSTNYSTTGRYLVLKYHNNKKKILEMFYMLYT